MLAALLLDGVAGALCGFLCDLLAALERFLAGLFGLGLDVVGDRAELAILDLGGGDQQAGDEADGEDLAGLSREELYERAQEADVEGRSSMSKQQLLDALS